jgi:hypothetical protein
MKRDIGGQNSDNRYEIDVPMRFSTWRLSENLRQYSEARRRTAVNCAPQDILLHTSTVLRTPSALRHPLTQALNVDSDCHSDDDSRATQSGLLNGRMHDSALEPATL